MGRLFNANLKVKSVGLSILGGVLFLGINLISTGVIAAKTSQYVVVAQNHLSPGIALTAGDFTLQTIKGEPPAGSYAKIPDLVNQHLLVDAVKGEPVTHVMVSDPNKITTIENLPQGFVAFWMPTAVGTTGYLSVGDTVNVYTKNGNMPVGVGARTFRVIGAVDNQGNSLKSGAGPASAVEIAVPNYLVPKLIENVTDLRLVLNPWGNVMTTQNQNGGIPNDQTNVVNPNSIPSGSPVPNGNPSVPQNSSDPKR